MKAGGICWLVEMSTLNDILEKLAAFIPRIQTVQDLKLEDRGINSL
jgi:hypothetical protein